MCVYSYIIQHLFIQLLIDRLCSLRESIENFSHNLVEWLFTALQDLPAPLGIRKVQSTLHENLSNGAC